uniref:Uncharacterized protein n=1 Tax=Candidatus Kentrum sp. TC TaxID=2126339 RepID=A0A451A717_9GAMM|nr:MAG: hypothetical protein BECKTC1821F_GA0114240_10634 [Candidatus Kentron sp. TC]
MLIDFYKLFVPWRGSPQTDSTKPHSPGSSSGFCPTSVVDSSFSLSHGRSESFPLQSVCWPVHAYQRLLYAGLSIHCRSSIASSNDPACVYQSEKSYRHSSGWLPPDGLSFFSSTSSVAASASAFSLRPWLLLQLTAFPFLSLPFMPLRLG